MYLFPLFVCLFLKQSLFSSGWSRTCDRLLFVASSLLLYSFAEYLVRVAKKLGPSLVAGIYKGAREYSHGRTDCELKSQYLDFQAKNALC